MGEAYTVVRRISEIRDLSVEHWLDHEGSNVIVVNGTKNGFEPIAIFPAEESDAINMLATMVAKVLTISADSWANGGRRPS